MCLVRPPGAPGVPGGRPPGTAPWAFHVAGPAGTREVTEYEAHQDPARTPRAGVPGAAEEFLADGGSPGRDLFVGEELRAYPGGRIGGIHLDDAGEDTKVIDVAGAGGECLHGEDVAR